MRIALVSPYDPFPGGASDSDAHVGGVERVFAELSRCLAARGHDVTVVCSSERAGTEDVHGVHVIRVPRIGTVMRAPLAPLAAHIPPADVIHVAATYPFTTPSVLREAHRRGVPCVLDFHFEPDPVSRIGRVAAWGYGLIGPRSYRLADAVLVRSHSYGSAARSLANVPTERWHEMPNGIDPERFHHTDAGGKDHILFVGRLVPYKGVEHLLHAMQYIDVPLRIAGDGPLRGPLQELANQLGVDVEFLGFVPEEDLPGLYRGASLTVLPSVGQQESFGISLLESMACGTPVVASDIPGVRDVARLGGLVAPSGDPFGLAAAIQEALAGGVPTGGVLARNIRQRYSWDAITERLLDVYGQVVAPLPEVTRARPRGDPVL